MTSLEDFLDEHVGGLFGLEGFDADDVQFLRREDAARFADDLDDVLSDVFGGLDDGEWLDDEVVLLAALGATEGGRVVQPQAFLLYSSATGAVHVLEMAPTSASTLAELPRLAVSLNDLRSMLRPSAAIGPN
jgi:hypothetical protein